MYDAIALSAISNPEQLADSLKAVELKLGDNLKHKLDELTAEYRRGDSLR